MKFHIAYIVFVYGNFAEAEEMLSAYFTASDWGEEMVRNNLEVSVFFRFHKDDRIKKNGVNYYFFADELPSTLKIWQTAKKFSHRITAVIQSTTINFLHLHNVNNIFSNRYIRKLNPNLPSIIQDHTGVYSPRHKLLHQLFMSDIDGLVFAAKGQEKSFVANKIIKKTQCYFVMENSSHFKYEDRSQARVLTEMEGNPVFLWVGHLNENKDPITVVKAFDRFLLNNENAKLYMIYISRELEPELRKIVENSELLSKSVTLLGARRRNEMEKYYNSADYIISGSHKEGSGYSIIEAMSCGVIPVVTDIPSFRSLTNSGEIGVLWNQGVENSLENKLLEIVKKPIEAESKKVRTHFEVNFSFNAIGKELVAVYTSIYKNRNI